MNTWCPVLLTSGGEINNNNLHAHVTLNEPVLNMKKVNTLQKVLRQNFQASLGDLPKPPIHHADPQTGGNPLLRARARTLLSGKRPQPLCRPPQAHSLKETHYLVDDGSSSYLGDILRGSVLPLHIWKTFSLQCLLTPQCEQPFCLAQCSNTN